MSFPAITAAAITTHGYLRAREGEVEFFVVEALEAVEQPRGAPSRTHKGERLVEAVGRLLRLTECAEEFHPFHMSA